MKIAELAKDCVEICGKACGAVTCRNLLEKEGGNRGCNRFIARCTNVAEMIIIDNKEAYHGKGNESRKETVNRWRRNAKTVATDAGDAEKNGNNAG